MKRILLLFLVTVPIMAIAGGGWPKKKGTGYYKLTEWWVISDRHYTSNGLIDPNVTTGIFNTSIYAEYGITDKVTGILYFPFFSKALHNDVISATTGQVTSKGEALNSIGDTDIGIKYALSEPGSQFAFAGSLILGLPLGKKSGGKNGSLQTGDGELNQLVRFDLSKSASINKIPVYANVYIGYNNRVTGFSDEFKFGAEAGLSIFNNKLWANVRLDVVESMKNGLTSAEGSQGATVFANNTEFASSSFEAAYYVSKKLGVSASYGSAFSGAIIFANPSYSLGIFLDLE